jgi:hypothetical protein
MSGAVRRCDDRFSITKALAYNGSNHAPFSFPVSRVLEDCPWGMIYGSGITRTAPGMETEVTSYRLGSGDKVFRMTLELGRFNQRKFGQVLGLLEIFDLET